MIRTEHRKKNTLGQKDFPKGEKKFQGKIRGEHEESKRDAWYIFQILSSKEKGEKIILYFQTEVIGRKSMQSTEIETGNRSFIWEIIFDSNIFRFKWWFYHQEESQVMQLMNNLEQKV